MKKSPWVSFCISTYKRPDFLRDQITLLLLQTFEEFDIVISDNDPEASAREVAASFGDQRIKYFHNVENIGMIKSFNKSIDRAVTEYIVMVTDDDPIEPNFLAEIFSLYQQHPDYSIYCGFLRAGVAPGDIEIISNETFIQEILDPVKTPWLLWSSSVMKKQHVLDIGKIPDYGSPHLADHALIVMTGSKSGGVLVNKMFSSLTLHGQNFSKSNLDYYKKGCEGFYNTLISFCKQTSNFKQQRNAILIHLSTWFIAAFFNLKKHYTLNNYNPGVLKELNEYAEEILRLPFMSRLRTKFALKTFIFHIKRVARILR